MAIGGSGNSVSTSRKLDQRRQLRKQRLSRRMLLEALESRQLMAFGPQLIGVQPNEGSLLQDGEVRNVAPRELVLRFDDQVAIDANTLSGIQLVRSGGDGFEAASVSSDLGSNAAVVLNFAAKQPGLAGNGIQVAFTQTNRSDSPAARVSVSGQRILIDVNSNPLLTTSAQDLLNAISASAPASALISATRVRGSQAAPIGGTVNTVTPLTLEGANAANAVSSLNAGTLLQVQFLAQTSGEAGRQVRVAFTSRDRGAGSLPAVSVSGTTVNVELNSNAFSPTTASDVINSININAAASSLVKAKLISGLGSTLVGNRAITYSPIALTGATNQRITPAYVGLGSTDREVIVRFAEGLPDDLYRLEIIGSGAGALRNVKGEAFNSGVNRAMQFELDLGAKIESIVPQPVTRENGRLVQERNRIDVYFNNDDFEKSKIEEVLTSTAPDEARTFFQVIYSRGTASTADDLVFEPTQIKYETETDRASLFFNRNLDQLVDPSSGASLPISELRLRIGVRDKKLAPPIPVEFNAVADAGSSFSTALNLDGTWSASSTFSQSLVVSSEIRNTTVFRPDFPGGSDEPGNRQIRPQDHLLEDADTVNGITTFNYNFQPVLGQFNGSLLVNAITEQQKTRTREVLTLLSQYYGVRFVETANLGLTLGVGDLRSVEGRRLNGPNGFLGVSGQLVSSGQPASVLDIQDFGNSVDNEFGGDFFIKMMQGVGFLLGLGLTDELPQLSVQSNSPIIGAGTSTEMVFPGDADIVHGQYLYRPDSTDIDLYQFTLPVSGRLSIEAFAERLASTSLLDATIKLYQKQPDGKFKQIAGNDNYYSNDPQLTLDLNAGTYMIGVSASGNENYNPEIADTGIGGKSEGRYQLRMDFRPPAASVLTDATGVAVDGDGDGRPGGVYNFWFRPSGPANTLFVDKAASPGGNGTILAPFKTIASAIAVATPGTVIRVEGNGGADGQLATLADNLSYDIGFNALGQALADGTSLDVPKEVTLVIDAGAIIKLRRAGVNVGSSSASVDRSGSALQVLGTPRLINSTGRVDVDSIGQPVSGSVYFTSIHDREVGKDANTDRVPPTVAAGDWAGITFQNNVDAGNKNRKNLEDNAIFLNYVSHADMRYGGGQVTVDGVTKAVSPINMIDSRPTVNFSQITRGSNAAMSATPNSFKESNFRDPQSQLAGLYSSDITRVGPDIHGNTVTGNSINGLFIRVDTSTANPNGQPLTVAGRFDDTDIVHVLTDNLTIAGTPGGPVLDTVSPSTVLVTLTAATAGTLAAGSYNYKIAFVDAAGNESPTSEPTKSVTVAANGSVALQNLPGVPSGTQFNSRRIYRSAVGDVGPYTLVAQINSGSDSYLDNGSTLGSTLVDRPLPLRAQFNGSLVIDPGTVLKLQGARIDVDMGGQLIAEGNDGQPVVFTSLNDNRYGAGGTFNNSSQGVGKAAVAGDWGGLIIGHTSSASLDHAVVAFGGGTTRIAGGFAGVNALEIHQAEARVTNSKFEDNAAGAAGTTDPDRAGRGTNFDGTIFVRGAQPILVGNTIVDSAGPAININVNSLNSDLVTDQGRSTGLSNRFTSYADNQGPLVRENRLRNNVLNGMLIRGQELTTEGVWDDTDIVHVVRNEIIVSNFHAFGGLRLESNAKASLVVKLANNGTTLAGLTATGTKGDIDDRIGGSIQIVGQPGFPVILTSLADDTAGAGFTPEGLFASDTDNNSSSGDGGVPLLPTGPEVDNGSLIDNDVAITTPGYFGFQPEAGGGSFFAGQGGITAQGNTQLLIDYNAIFAFTNYIDVGPNGSAVSLATTTITTPPTLIAPDLVISQGTFNNASGNVVRWRVETRLDNGIAKVNNTLILDSDSALGEIQFINYLDEDVLGASDDFLYVTGTPGESDFRAFTIDDRERVGFSHGGAYVAGNDLQNATYLGWAADRYPLLDNIIQGAGTTYTVAGNINRTNLTPRIDPVLGQIFGLADVTTAFAWRVDPNASNSRILSFLELIPRDPALASRGGDWRSVRMDTLSNDRNVGTVQESESSNSAGAGANGLPSGGQYLGQLAPNLNSGDENARLGFVVQGAVGSPTDLDVYSFTGKAGTEVYLDIDRTTSSLDTVLELVDANGNILALSDSTLAEDANPALLYQSPNMAANSVLPLRKSPRELYPTNADGSAKDLYSTNPRDAGMRVILPGEAGSNNLYHVRVRSSSLKTAADPVSNLVNSSSLTGGLTSGVYQLQIRLQELDEVAGSSVSYGDIRFAQNGLELIGLPRHSPLLGENSEVDAGNLAANAQQLGNLLNTDRQAISVAGNISSNRDVDWFSFDIRYQNVTPRGLVEYFSTIFDIDYADGLGRPDLKMFVFDSTGRLLLRGLGSNIIDDRGTSLTDLNGGSTGGGDPYIGTFELPEGRYLLAVTSNAMGYSLPDLGAVNNGAVRVYPISGSRLIANDHVDKPALLPSEVPVVDSLFDSSSFVPYTLGDVNLYVSQDVGIERTNLYMVNGFSGQVMNTVGRFNFDVQDIAFRYNGQLRAFDRPYENPPAAGTDLDTLVDYINIDPGTAVATDVGDAGFNTFNLDAAAAVVDSNDGLDVQAVTFGSFGGFERGFAVANRPFSRPGPQYFSNILYEFDEGSGAFTSAPAANRANADRVQGAGTEIRERGYIETNPVGSAVARELVATEATRVAANGTTTRLINDGTRFRVVTTGGTVLNFEMNSGPEYTFAYDPANGIFVRDGDRFEVNGSIYEFDTGPVAIVSAANGAAIGAGTTISITDNTAGPVTRTFEFTKNGTVGAGNVAVNYTDAATQSDLVNALVAAINGQSGFAVKATRLAATNRITLTNTSPVFNAFTGGAGLTVEGQPGNSVGLAIPVEETFTADQFLDSIQRAIGNAATVSRDGTRVNFSGANTAVVTDLTNRGIFQPTSGNGSVSPGSIGVSFLASDDAEDIAARIARAITTSGAAGISATSSGRSVLIAGGSLQSADSPFVRAGIAPGGTVTGIAQVGSDLYAVSNAGGLYRVSNPTGLTIGNIGSYVTASSDLLGINFTGLTAGPARLANGSYADLLFGVDAEGVVYAFNTSGQLQPVFAGGKSSVATGLTRANGLTFAPLDYNLWHTTSQRGNDPGHGLPALPDGTRTSAVPGNQSYYFGFESPAANGVNYTNVTDPGFRNSYNFAGGAQGAMVSKPFSLSGVSASDQPVLYFNYLLNTEDANSDLNDNDPMLDSFRVFISGDDGVWHLLSTNNGERGAGAADDELDLVNARQNNVKRQLYDNFGSWRQANVDLGAYAGRENLRLRFEFSTAGSFGYGAQGGRGPELRLLSGDQLRDGQTLTVNGVNFEIEQGPTLVVPGGASLNDGDFVLVAGLKFVFDDGSGPAVTSPDIAVPFTKLDTASDLAQRLSALIAANRATKSVVPGFNFLQEGNETLTTSTRSGVTGDSIRIVGTGSIGDNPALVTNPASDVDLVRVELSRGASVQVNAVASSIGSTLDPFVRIFNSAGVEIARNDNAVSGNVDSRVTFVAPADGIYYIGVSGAGNSSYNPAVAGTAVNGSTGNYELTIDVTRLLNPTVSGNRIQLEGASQVTTSANNSLVVEGALGTTGVPVFINNTMTADEVGAAVRAAIANSLAQGSTRVFSLSNGMLDLTGMTVTSSGPFGLTTSFPTDPFGGFNTSTNFDGSRDSVNQGALRAQNNNFEGVYIDDFIIGLAERGEMVVNAPVLTDFGPAIPDDVVDTDIVQGAYQLEIRGGSLRGINPPSGTPAFRYTEIYEPNARGAEGTSIQFFDATRLSDGQVFTISDGIKTVTFEFEDSRLNNGVANGNIPVPFSTNALNPVTGVSAPDTAATIAGRVRTLINSSLVQSLIKIRAVLSNGDVTGSTSDTIALFGTATVDLPATAGNVIISTDTGDTNRKRDQGQVIIDSTKISNSAGFGIVVTAGALDANTNAPNPGSPRLTVVENTLRQAPGVVISNNELAFNAQGGISISGAPTVANNPATPVPVARVFNNTIVGGRIAPPTGNESAVYNNQFFEQGRVSFADSVTAYNPNFGGGPAPAAGLQIPSEALAIPNYSGVGEPTPGQGVVSLGRGGQLTLQFTNNRLTGSGDSKPDLMVVEVGDPELVNVEVSTDGVNWTSVGTASASSQLIDIDAYGFTPTSRLAFVRLTDVAADGATTGASVGADIDAVGAITTIAVDRYQVSGDGISVTNNASPTLLNNVVTNSTNGLRFDASSASTIVGGTLFQGNATNAAGSASLGQFSTVVSNDTPIFTAPAKGNFYPSVQSALIDSSIDSLADRPNLVSVKQGIGIPASPILAPALDRNGLLRVDDPSVNSPSGLGGNVFKDRGSLDRADFVGPSIKLVNPVDNDANGLDTNSEVSVVELTNVSLNYFDIQLVDGQDPSGLSRGSNIDDSTVSSNSIVLLKNRVPLTEGIDYRFGYDATNNVIRLTPLAGVWQLDSVYQVRFVNQGASLVQVQAPAAYTDGSTFEIVDNSGARKTFEIDLGSIITVPSNTSGTALVADGTVFAIDDGTQIRNFEFDTNGRVLAGNAAVTITTADTAAQVADKIVAAVTASTLSTTLVSIGGGRLQLSGSSIAKFLPINSGLTVVGQPGVRGNFGLSIPLSAGSPTGLTDGQSFTIQRTGGSAVRFEIDFNGVITPGSIPVRLSNGLSAAAVGQVIATAINATGLNLNAAYVGSGLVELRNSADVSLNLLATVLKQSGLPGQSGAVAVPLSASTSSDASTTAKALASAINSSGLVGVSAIAIGSEVLIEGASGVAGLGSTGVSPIRDLAGNSLRSNQTNGTTTVTIFLGQGLDYGDAPDPVYATLNENNGARHVVVPGFSLGATVSPDADARLIDADSDDGVTFATPTIAAFSTRLIINAQGVQLGRNGLLDAWVDFNGNGTFEASERIANRLSLTNGDNTLNYVVPGTAKPGTTYARFRYSSQGVSSAIGSASDGEVEDYAVTIVSNPYQNATNRLDVNGDGFVSPIDALQVINELNRTGARPFTVPVPPGTNLPPYLDVNGDGQLSPIDALVVINYLNANVNGEGESGLGSGEGEGNNIGWSISTLAQSGFQAAPASPRTSDSYVEYRLGDLLLNPVTTVGPSYASVDHVLLGSADLDEIDSLYDFADGDEDSTDGLDDYFASLN